MPSLAAVERPKTRINLEREERRRRAYALHDHVPHPRGEGKRAGKERHPRSDRPVDHGRPKAGGCLLRRRRWCQGRPHRRRHARGIPDPLFGRTPHARFGGGNRGPSRDDPRRLGQGDPGVRAGGPKVRLGQHAQNTARGRREVSEEENKALIRRWIEAFNERDLQGEADLLAPGYVAHVPSPQGPLDLEGLEAWRGFTAPFVEAFPDLRLTIEDIAAEGDTVAARVSFRGNHQGEFQGIPPTGKEVNFTSMEFNRVVGGKVEEHWVEIDLLRVMGQVGALPEPEHSEEANPT